VALSARAFRAGDLSLHRVRTVESGDFIGVGLGRAVDLFALQRLREEGATTALVACCGDDAYPVPLRLYESVGFREQWRRLAYRRATDI